MTTETDDTEKDTGGVTPPEELDLKLPKGPATPEKYLAKARVRSAEHRQARKKDRVPERRVFGSIILDILLERDAKLRRAGVDRLNPWFDEALERIPRYYSSEAARQVINGLREAAYDDLEDREAAIDRRKALKDGGGERG